MATREARGAMRVSFEAQIKVIPTAAEGGRVATAPVGHSQEVRLTTGTTAAKFDRAWSNDKMVIGASATDTYVLDSWTLTAGVGGDLTNNVGFGATNDNLGQTMISMAELVGLFIANTGTTTLRIEPGSDGEGTDAPSFWNVSVGTTVADADTIDIPSNGFFAIGGGEDGWSSQDGTSDTFRITNLDASAGEYSITIFGRSA